MKFAKKLMCIFVIFALTVPYVVYAENDTDEISEFAPIFLLSDGDPNQGEEPLSGTEEPNNEEPALSESDKNLLEYIVEELANLNVEKLNENEDDMLYKIDISDYNYSVDDFDKLRQTIVELIQHDHPEIYFLKFTYVNETDPESGEPLKGFTTNLGYTYTGDKVNFAYFDLKMTPEEIEAENKIIDDEVKNITSGLTDDMGDVEKILAVHDYIIYNYEYDARLYDDEGLENRTLDGMVNDKCGVCQAYSYLFKYTMNSIGIGCETVPADACSHMWNKVQVGGSEGKWYNIDLTFDDPEIERQQAILTTYAVPFHAFFLLSDYDMYQLDEKQHWTHNAYRWDGSEMPNITESYPADYIRSIKGNVALSGRKFYCIDNTDVNLSPDAPGNNICTIDFENEGLSEPVYTFQKDNVWRVHGNIRSYWQSLYANLVAYDNEIYFNTPDKIMKLLTSGEAETVYDFATENVDSELIDVSNTYFYGLAVKDDKLIAEYATSPYGDDATEMTNMPEDYIEIQTENIAKVIVKDEEKLATSIYVLPKHRETAVVYIAVYDDNGALIRLVPQAAEGNVTEFTPEDEAKTIKAFIWGLNNEPIANDEYEIPKVTLKAENLDDTNSDIENGKLQFFPDSSAETSTKYEIDSDAEWYVNGVKLTDEVKGSYATVAEYAYNEFILGRYSTVTLRKTDSLPAYNKIVIDTHTTAVVYKTVAYDEDIDIIMRDPDTNPMTGSFPENTIDSMYVYNEKSEETSPASYTFTLDGKAIQPSELRKNDVLSIAYDETGDFEDSSFYHVTVSRKSQRGVIEEVNNGGKTVIFGDNVYATAEEAFIGFETGDDCIFYFDAYGKIAYAELAEPEIPSIGILTDVHEDNGVYTAELIDNTGAKKIYSVRAANGETYMDYFREFKDEEGNWIVNRSVAYPQLVVRYNIYGLELVIGERKLVATDSSGLYKASSERISKIKLFDQTVIFDITGIDEDIDNYRVISVDDLVDETNYTGYAYDMRRYYNNKYMGLVITSASKSETPDAS